MVEVEVCEHQERDPVNPEIAETAIDQNRIRTRVDHDRLARAG
ncbi:MAG: hypothetical protein QOC66_845 [Pseudonocardiales bacterium]|nr:hypothetical protein [Pseudonocardiales bacterium]